jgi:hypothetical protein
VYADGAPKNNEKSSHFMTTGKGGFGKVYLAEDVTVHRDAFEYLKK